MEFQKALSYSYLDLENFEHTYDFSGLEEVPGQPSVKKPLNSCAGSTEQRCLGRVLELDLLRECCCNSSRIKWLSNEISVKYYYNY